ncbi:MAG: hypothetical protein R3E73_05910 [Porticoccaceae bacterium]
MKPSITPVARELGDRLANQIAPQLTGFEAATASMMSQMLEMISEEWDRAASRLVEENTAIREILQQAAEVFNDDNLKTKACEKDTDLRISHLEQSNHQLRDLLTDIHARAEQTDSAEAHVLEEAIWNELRASVKRRQLSSANF